MAKRGIVQKTFLFSALLIVLVVTLSFSVLYFIMPRYYHYKKGQTLSAKIDTLAAQLQGLDALEECSLIISTFAEENNVMLLSYSGEDLLLPELSTPFLSILGGKRENISYYSAAVEGIGLPLQGGAAGQEPTTIKIHGTFDHSTEEPPSPGPSDEVGVMLSTTFSWSGPDAALTLRREIDSSVMGYIVMHGTLQPIDEAKEVLLSLMPYVLAAGILVGLTAAWFYARQLSKPILRISEAAVKMQRMEPGISSGVRSRDELGQLSRDLDALYDGLCETIEQLRAEMDKVGRLEQSKTEMMQSAGHELKTPIAALSGILDGMIDNIGIYQNRERYLSECRAEVEKLSALVSEILAASQSDLSENAAVFEPTQVDALVRHALNEHAAALRGNGLRVTEQLSPAVLSTDPVRLYRVLSNLIGNAARYATPGGEVSVLLTDALLRVENDCPPIPAEELPRLFEPFYTGEYSRDRSKNGTGLGLYIVKQNLDRLGIRFDAVCTPRGLAVTLYFT